MHEAMAATFDTVVQGIRNIQHYVCVRGGMLLRDMLMPEFCEYAVEVKSPEIKGIGDTHVLGP